MFSSTHGCFMFLFGSQVTNVLRKSWNRQAIGSDGHCALPLGVSKVGWSMTQRRAGPARIMRSAPCVEMLPPFPCCWVSWHNWWNMIEHDWKHLVTCIRIRFFPKTWMYITYILQRSIRESVRGHTGGIVCALIIACFQLLLLPSTHQRGAPKCCNASWSVAGERQ